MIVIGCVLAVLVIATTFTILVWYREEDSARPRNSGDRAKRKAALVRQASRMFSSAGWNVTKAGNLDFELLCSKGVLQVFVSCFDKSDLYFKSPGALLETCESTARTFSGSASRTLVFFTNVEQTKAFTSTSEHKGLIILSNNDKELLQTIPRYEKELPGKLDPRVERILAKNQNFCLILSRRFFDAGDRDHALLWARRATKARHLGSVKFFIIFNHLLLIKDFDGAEAFGKDFCDLHSRDVDAIDAMVKLYLDRKDFERALEWALRSSQEGPGVLSSHIALAVAYEGLGIPAKALSCISRATEVAPFDRDVLEAGVRIAQAAAASDCEQQWSARLKDVDK